MDSIIDELLKVDKRAHDIIMKAQEYYDETLKSIDEDKKHLLDEYNSKAESHIKDVIETEELTVESKKTEILKNTEEIEVRLNQVFETNRKNWEQELFERCVGGE